MLDSSFGVMLDNFKINEAEHINIIPVGWDVWLGLFLINFFLPNIAIVLY